MFCSFYEREENRTKQLFGNKNSAILYFIILVSSINFNNCFCVFHLIQDTVGFSNNLDNFLLKREYNMGPEKLQVCHPFYNALDGFFHIIYIVVFNNDSRDLLQDKVHQLGARLAF
jgi:hypothetical protein